MLKKFAKILLGIICFLAISTGMAYAPASAETDDCLYLGGFPAGFVLNTQTVEVIGLCDIFTESGAICPARDSGIKCGDIITRVNDREIKSAADLTSSMSEDYSAYNLTVLRAGEELNLSVDPIVDKNNGKKRVGLLVKDTINGIGTVTYIDKTNNKFGSLGHPVTDTEGNVLNINGGSLFGCTIYDVKRGLRGNPGELKGIFDNAKSFGTIKVNCRCGIFGNITPEYDVSTLTEVKKGNVEDVTVGKAYIYSTLGGNKGEEYEVNIVKVDAGNKDNRNFVLKITDKRILDKSGGIVQGMSGSPIVQDGKIIGAVTHVFVNDPTRGYGIAIDKMISSY